MSEYNFITDANIHKYRTRYSTYDLILTMNLKIFRVMRNYNVKKMAMLCGIAGRKQYLRFENGKYGINAKWLYVFSKVLDVKPSDFFVNRLDDVGYRKDDLIIV